MLPVLDDRAMAKPLVAARLLRHRSQRLPLLSRSLAYLRPLMKPSTTTTTMTMTMIVISNPIRPSIRRGRAIGVDLPEYALLIAES